MAEWGLQAIIRPNEYDEDHHHHHHHLHHLHHHHQQQHQQQQDDCFGSIDIKKEYDQALLFCFPHLFDNHDHPASANTMEAAVVAADDFNQQLYKSSFYTAAPPPATAEIQINHLQRFHNSDQESIQRDQEIKNLSRSGSNASQLAPKLKKRKNQQKRVVVQVTAAGLSSDPWAWRKYGQKPIKGSIYPRSYYRCSSSKACMARRQVEQSCTDSSIYILTYTAEHNHAQPTRRNSLAGINRNRFKAKSPTDTDGTKTVTKSKGSQVDDSPTTVSASSVEDDQRLQQSNIKEETTLFNQCDINQGQNTMMQEINDEDYMVFSDDFFEGLEDLGGYKMESSGYNNYASNKQFPHVFC